MVCFHQLALALQYFTGLVWHLYLDYGARQGICQEFNTTVEIQIAMGLFFSVFISCTPLSELLNLTS